MAYKKITKQDREFQMFQDFWKILQNHYITENTKEYWDSVLNDTDAFIRKYDRHCVAYRLGWVVVDILDDLASDREYISENYITETQMLKEEAEKRKRLNEMPTITETLRMAVNDVCDHYCKYFSEFQESKSMTIDEFQETYCADCPMRKL